VHASQKEYTPARISQFLDTFEDYGIVTTTHKNLGRRGGHMRLISFVSQDMFDKMEELLP